MDIDITEPIEQYVGNNKAYYENTLKKNEQETILCAAIWYRDAELKVDIPDNRNPYNISEGTVICGHRHPHAMWTYTAITGLDHASVGRYYSGFLTNCNRFVGRIEAGKIAYHAGQLDRSPCHKGKWQEIYSEDLY